MSLVLQLKPSKDTAEKALGQKRDKSLKKYVSDFRKKLEEKLKQPKNCASNDTNMDTTDYNEKINTSASTGNTTMDSVTSLQSRNQQQPPRGNEGSPEVSPMILSSSINTNTSLQQCQMSPISTHSVHDLTSNTFGNISAMSIEDRESDNIRSTYLSLLFLENSSSSYSFDDSIIVPRAKPLHMYTNNDLRPVQCIQSFLYIVFSNPKDYEVTFFKVNIIYKIHVYIIYTHLPCILSTLTFILPFLYIS